MLYYNITFCIEPQVEAEYLDYKKTTFLPAIIATKLTKSHKLMQLLTEIDNGGISYSLQLGFEDMEDYMSFEMTYLPQLIRQFDAVFKGKYVSFNTLLKQVI